MLKMAVAESILNASSFNLSTIFIPTCIPYLSSDLDHTADVQLHACKLWAALFLDDVPKVTSCICRGR